MKNNMKNLFLVLISIFMFSAASAQTTRIYYTCVMHPEIKQDKPGNCPKCGMALIKKAVKVAAPKPAPKNQQEMPKPVPNAEPVKTEVVYACVMHPEVQEDKPGKCPKCRMTLIKKAVKVAVQNPVVTKDEKNEMAVDKEEHNHAEEETDTTT